MAKVKKLLAEMRESQNREIDLVDQNITALEEFPSLCEYSPVGMTICGQNSLWVGTNGYLHHNSWLINVSFQST